MAEKILPPGTRYYAGGTVSRTTGKDGLVEPDRMATAQYLVEKTAYSGGTIPKKIIQVELDENGRELFR